MTDLVISRADGLGGLVTIIAMVVFGLFKMFLSNRAEGKKDEWETDWGDDSSSNTGSSANTNSPASRTSASTPTNVPRNTMTVQRKPPAGSSPAKAREVAAANEARAQVQEALRRRAAMLRANEQAELAARARAAQQAAASSQGYDNDEQDRIHELVHNHAEAQTGFAVAASRLADARTQDALPSARGTSLQQQSMRVVRKSDKKKGPLKTDRASLRQALIMREVLDRPRCFDI